MMHKKSAGFSLPEIILIVAVLAIVSGMAFPDMASFFARQRLEQERTELEQIKRAMEVYSRQCGGLPSLSGNPTNCRNPGGGGNLAWYEALSSVSNLSASEIQMDTWGVRRRYSHQIDDSVNFLGGTGNMAFHYGTVRSLGPNRCDNTALAVGAACTAPDFEFNSNNTADNWTLATYGSYTVRGDDMIVKFTDNQIKAAAYEETLRRLERVIAALDRYAQAKFNEAIVVADDECVSERVFYPPSSQPSFDYVPAAGSTGCATITSRQDIFSARVMEDGYLETDVADDDLRRRNMENLMRLLGLPLDHARSALTDRAFYYYSTPGVMTPTGCHYSQRPPYLPPKVTVEPDDCG